MNDLIDRQAAIEALKKQMSDWNDLYNIPVIRSIVMLEQLPSAQPERNTGVWLEDEDDPESAMTDGYCGYCSVCKEMSEYLTAYCGNCGADMRGTWDEKCR